jgi:hypothetical protein
MCIRFSGEHLAAAAVGCLMIPGEHHESSEKERASLISETGLY